MLIGLAQSDIQSKETNNTVDEHAVTVVVRTNTGHPAINAYIKIEGGQAGHRYSYEGYANAVGKVVFENVIEGIYSTLTHLTE